jgi:7-cyano-7-deazaguanine synthase
LDSGCLLAELCEKAERPEGLFVDYGQRVAEAERAAAAAISAELGAHFSTLKIEGIEVPSGEIAGRNALLVHLALTWLGESGPANIYLGIHTGTTYRDCSPDFVTETQRSLDFQSGGVVRLVAPYVSWPKQLIFDRAVELGFDVGITHSCERSDVPCGICNSCVDRRDLFAHA